ncbi:hypothetical protein SAMN05444340_106185 [Citreimonas salinaria]|uniref:TnsA endonuclease N terminal n=2 Tax=Citreimonas salinaria TaxID=321339 RepID=A0A1H3JBT7_9RHOB|nr:hypothetical protein SAMN05444340_106185 [Citreimonas salinaria]
MHMTPSGAFLLPQPPNAARRIKMGVQKHFTGSLVIGDEGQVVEFESHTEKLTALVMLARPDVVHLESQIPFGWRDQAGQEKTHTFDLRVTYVDGKRVALFVKNSREAAKAEFRAETLLIASQVTPDFADRVSLVTEKNLDPIEVYNAELLHSVRIPDPEADAAVRRVVAETSGAVKIENIVSAAGCSGRGFLATVRMIRTHDLELVARERIEREALVRRRIL